MEENHNDNNEEQILPLDDAAIGMIAEIRENVRAAQISVNTILNYFARQHQISGQLNLADNGKELIIRPLPAGALR